MVAAEYKHAVPPIVRRGYMESEHDFGVRRNDVARRWAEAFVIDTQQAESIAQRLEAVIQELVAIDLDWFHVGGGLMYDVAVMSSCRNRLRELPTKMREAARKSNEKKRQQP